MPWQLNLTATVVHTNAQFQPNGEEFTFTSSQVFGGEAPQPSDLNALVTSAATVLSANIQAQFPVDLVINSDNGAGGGAG